MENLILLGTILTVHIFAWFTPGPLFVLILRNSPVYSRKSGIMSFIDCGINQFWFL